MIRCWYPVRRLFLGQTPRWFASQANRTLALSCGVVEASSHASNERSSYLLGVAAAMSAGLWASNNPSTKCEESPHHHDPLTPADVGSKANSHLFEEDTEEDLPVYTSDEVAERDGEDGKPIWMSYGGIVYDVTDFIPNHPGGDEKILMAAGSSIEPFWHEYRQHFASDLPIRLMERMIVGRLDPDDQDKIDEQLAVLQDESEDPYANEPRRHKSLIVHSDTPMNAECPAPLLTENYYTPASLFYIRHHHPVPYLTEQQLQNYKLEVDLTAMGGKGKAYFTLDELKSMPSVDITATLQCSGNRRSGFNEFQRTSGTTWGQGAISNAKWTGVKLSEVLKRAGMGDFELAQSHFGMNHIRFHALDSMMASIGIEKALNPYGDVILCYEMNGAPLPRDHGFPLRAIVPGYAAVRNVKWLSKIEVAAEEAEGPWQRGLNYKTLPPSVTDANDVALNKMPSMTEASLFSGITEIVPLEEKNGKEQIMVYAKGWAWAGGGRNIVRVDLSGDDGKTWASANLLTGSDQPFGRAWAWTFWECRLPATVREDGSVHLVSKSVDMAFNVQPENCHHIWNVRGLGNNSWYRAAVDV